MVPGPDPALGWSRAWLLWFYKQLCHQQQTGQWGPSAHGQDIPKITPTAQGGPCPSRVSCRALMDGSGQGSRLGLFSHPDSWESSSSTKYMMFVTAL